MTTVHVQLDDVTYERLRQIAGAAGLSLDVYLARWAKNAAGVPLLQSSLPDRLAGWLADEPQLADAIDRAAERSRRERFGGPHASDDR